MCLSQSHWEHSPWIKVGVTANGTFSVICSYIISWKKKTPGLHSKYRGGPDPGDLMNILWLISPQMNIRGQRWQLAAAQSQILSPRRPFKWLPQRPSGIPMPVTSGKKRFAYCRPLAQLVCSSDLWRAGRNDSVSSFTQQDGNNIQCLCFAGRALYASYT